MAQPTDRPFPLWPDVYYFAQWRANGTFERPCQASNRADRLAQDRRLLALSAAQRIKLAPRLSQQRVLAPHK